MDKVMSDLYVSFSGKLGKLLPDGSLSELDYGTQSPYSTEFSDLFIGESIKEL